MRARRLVAVAVLVAGSVFTSAAGRAASGDLAPDPERFALACVGAMATDGSVRPDMGDPRHRIMANAVVDLAAGTVQGFGIGAAPIVTVTPGLIGFGTAAVDAYRLARQPAAPEAPKGGTIVEGSFNRVSGATVVVVHPAADPERVLIAMRLDCQAEHAPG